MGNSYIKKRGIFLKYRSKWRRGIRFFLIGFISTILTTTLVTPTAAQIWFPPSSTSQTYTTPWWDLYKAKPCGKYWCSRVYLNTGKSWSKPFEKLTVANQPDPKLPSTEVALNIEERARVVQRTLSQIVQATTNSPKILKAKPEVDWKDLFQIGNKPLHPVTPKLKVGIENKQTVVYVPAQPELELSQQAIITVNRVDARANGKALNELAQSWRNLIQRHLSEKLWGYELDTNYPWLRASAAAAIGAMALIALLALGFISQILKQLERKIHRGLSRLTKSLAVNPESASAEQLAELEKLKILTPPAEPSATKSEEDNTSDRSVSSTAESFSARSQTPDNLVSQPETLTPSTSTQLHRISIFNFWQKAIRIRKILSTQMQTFGRIHPQTSLLLQVPLKQIENLNHLLIRLLFWGQIFIFLMGMTSMLLLFPATRLYFRLFFFQAIFLPLTWMLVSIADKIFAVLIDYSLNQWASEAQLNNPASNRYALRVTTYSPVLKKVTTFIFVSIAIYVTVLLLGINPRELAGAGVVAVVLAFLSRNLLENMLNGILILAGDRYALGDVIEVNGLAGCVENMNLFTTGLRNLDGQLIIIPNSLIGTVINMTKDWSRVNFSIKIAYNADVNKAKEILQQVAQQMQKEPEWQDKILEPPTILGVDEVSHEGILLRMLIKTAPSQQWALAREFRPRVQRELIEAGISLGIPQSAVWQISPHLSNSQDNFIGGID
ncbi:MAG: mechanosensitive ion channel family protein [Prochloraceae cyanobacterium]|nr:mechanosensitive ion channel family protein [Prochloraceae cyanobacterium]